MHVNFAGSSITPVTLVDLSLNPDHKPEHSLELHSVYEGFEVLMSVTMKSRVIWNKCTDVSEEHFVYNFSVGDEAQQDNKQAVTRILFEDGCRRLEGSVNYTASQPRR
jgi:hypothetical protein